ncbi:MAG: energy-coupling factor ABC transporter permease, partial [Desulfobacterales bacterium]|nr:energy-coupling factor ABC transporter permease [Desulfobacterales bacterium]
AMLTVQALFFGDGGLLALGCNIFNLGFFPCFIGYPLIYQFTVRHPNPRTILAGSMLSAVTALQLGALAVVLETVFSGISQLPFRSFVLLMLPVHLAIGVVEGLMTSGIIGFVWKARPRMIGETLMPASAGSLKKAAAGFLAATVLTGGFLAWFASSHPDGLEWAVEKVTGAETLPDSETAIHRVFSDIQNHTTVLPDYSFPSGTREAETAPAWPAVDSGATVSGLFGALLVLALCFLIAMGVKALNRNRSAPDGKA